jgi:hypothetical protein
MNPAAPPPITRRSRLRTEDKGNTVVAVALARGTGSVIEHMALMATTPTAVILRPGENQLEI